MTVDYPTTRVILNLRSMLEGLVKCTSCGVERDNSLACTTCGASAELLNDLTTTLHINRGNPTPAPNSSQASSSEERLSDDERAVLRGLSPESAVLIIQRGPSAGARFLLNEPIESIGRHPTSSIFLDDISVSRKHALLKHSLPSQGESGYLIEDVGSLNGTYVNGQRVEIVSLHSGDEVRIGKFRLIYFTGDMS